MNGNVSKPTPRRFPRQLDLGEHYMVRFPWGNMVMCKFIKVTKCGFNFLNIETNRCVLRNHLYLSKCENHLSETWFWMNEDFDVKHIIIKK